MTSYQHHYTEGLDGNSSTAPSQMTGLLSKRRNKPARHRCVLSCSMVNIDCQSGRPGSVQMNQAAQYFIDHDVRPLLTSTGPCNYDPDRFTQSVIQSASNNHTVIIDSKMGVVGFASASLYPSRSHPVPLIFCPYFPSRRPVLSSFHESNEPAKEPFSIWDAESAALNEASLARRIRHALAAEQMERTILRGQNVTN
jgi:hypothetical protein